MKLEVAKEIFEKYPEVEIGLIVIKDFDNQRKIKINNLENFQEELRKNLSLEKVQELPVIKRWREVYKSFGANPPSQYRCSIEALLRRLLKSNLPKINELVDLYNYISIKYLMPVGGEDLDKIYGNLRLDFANGDEEFIPLGSNVNNPPLKGEVVYKDDAGIICRCWNWREGDRTKITEKTKNAILVMEDINKSGNLKEALNEIEKLVKEDENTIINILNKNNKELELLK